MLDEMRPLVKRGTVTVAAPIQKSSPPKSSGATNDIPVKPKSNAGESSSRVYVPPTASDGQRCAASGSGIELRRLGLAADGCQGVVLRVGESPRLGERFCARCRRDAQRRRREDPDAPACRPHPSVPYCFSDSMPSALSTYFS